MHSFAARTIKWDTPDVMDEAPKDGLWIDMNSMNISWEMKVAKERNGLAF